MVETAKIKKFGNSLGILFDKGSLENVYGLQEGSEVEIDYKFPLIQIKPKITGGAVV